MFRNFQPLNLMKKLLQELKIKNNTSSEINMLEVVVN